MSWNETPDKCPKDDSCYEYHEGTCQGTEDVGMVCKRKRKLMNWFVMEELEDALPYLELGWNGFVPMVIYRTHRT